jgi:hypothetical protein
VSIEGHAMATTAQTVKNELTSFGAMIFWELDPIAVGLGAAQSLSQARQIAAGSATNEVTRFSVEARYRFGTRPVAGKIFIVAAVGGGAIRVLTRTSLTGSDPENRSVSTIFPVASTGVAAGFQASARWQVMLGARLDVLRQNTRFLMRGQAIYESGWVQPSADFAVSFHF